MTKWIAALTISAVLGSSACRDIVSNPDYDAPDSASGRCEVREDGGSTCPGETPVCDELTGNCCTIACRTSGAFCGDDGRCRVCSTGEECSSAGLGETCTDGGVCE